MWRDTILNIFYPPYCIFCNSVMDYRTELCVCDDCVGMLPNMPANHCAICSSPSDGYICTGCKENIKHFDKVVSPYVYFGCTANAIKQLKFHKRIDYAKTMGIIMAGQVLRRLDKDRIDIIIPVPISKKRQTERQYNQSELLAKEISKVLKIPYCKRTLIKIRETEKQSTLPAKKRVANVYGAYSVKDSTKIDGKNVLLVDDVITTGCTLDECSRTLKNNEADNVFVSVFAATGKLAAEPN